MCEMPRGCYDMGRLCFCLRFGLYRCSSALSEGSKDLANSVPTGTGRPQHVSGLFSVALSSTKVSSARIIRMEQVLTRTYDNQRVCSKRQYRARGNSEARAASTLEVSGCAQGINEGVHLVIAMRGHLHRRNKRAPSPRMLLHPTNMTCRMTGRCG